MFLDNNRQHIPEYSKRISSWVGKVLCIANTHMSRSIAWSVVVSPDFSRWCLSSVHTAAGQRARVFYLYPCHGIVQHLVLGLHEYITCW